MISQEAAKEIEIYLHMHIAILRFSEVFALQVDESTDISGHAHLISNVRYINGCELIEDF